MDRWQASIERAERRRLEKLKAEREAALQAQRDAALLRRDKQQQSSDQQRTALQGNIAASNSAMDHANSMQRDQQQQRAIRSRDAQQNQFDTQQERQKAQYQRQRDEQQFGYSRQQSQQEFEQQTQRDQLQHGLSTQRDQLQHGQTMQRDMLQGGIQAYRDWRMNDINAEQDARQQSNLLERESLQNDFQSQRDSRLNLFDTQRDVRRQQFEQQSRYQAEAADISARWQEQVHVAKNAGLDFSQAQQEEMKQLEKAFRKNVLNGDLTEDLKQRAMVEHQKQMSTFVPEERIVAPQDRFQQSIVQDEQTGQRFLVVQDPRGGVKYEPLDGGMGEQAGMMRQQAQDQQRQAEAISKKQLDRVTQFQSVYDQVETILDENDRPKFNTPEKVMAEAMRRFAPRERIYQMDGLPPLGQFLNPDEFPQSQQGDPQQPPQPQQQPSNPWRAAVEQRKTGMADSLKSRSGDNMATMPPVLLATKPLPKPVTERLSKLPGGDQLAKLRDTHKSNSVTDQVLREATDTVINAMMTNDTSDPHLPDAVKLLKKAGWQLDLGQ